MRQLLLGGSVAFALTASGLVVPAVDAAASSSVNGRIAYVWQSVPQQNVQTSYGADTVDPDDTDRVRLDSGMRPVREIRWSPDGTRVAWTHLGPNDDDRESVNVTRPGGTDYSWGIADEFRDNFAPAWSPEGSQLAYLSSLDRTPASPAGDLMVNSGGQYGVMVTTNAQEPDWGPTNRIAFARDGQVHTIAPDGSGDQVVAAGRNPHWNHDGTRIAFVATDGIVSTAPDGTGRQVLVAGVQIGTSFDLSPDDTAVVYAPPGGTLRVRTLASGAEHDVDPHYTGIVVTNVDWGTAPVFPPLYCTGRLVTMRGTSGHDWLRGTERADVIVGLGGDDALLGFGGDDVLCGGAGNDRLEGGDGNDLLVGESGADTISGNQGVDTVSYGGRTVAVNVTIGNSKADDGSLTDGPAGARDSVWWDVENVIGSESSDVITGNAAINRLEGRGGNDTLIGGLAADWLYGGGKSDLLQALDGRKDHVIDCGADYDKAPSYDKGLDPRPISCP